MFIMAVIMFVNLSSPNVQLCQDRALQQGSGAVTMCAPMSSYDPMNPCIDGPSGLYCPPVYIRGDK